MSNERGSAGGVLGIIFLAIGGILLYEVLIGNASTILNALRGTLTSTSTTGTPGNTPSGGKADNANPWGALNPKGTLPGMPPSGGLTS